MMSLGRSFFVGLEPTKGWGPFKRFDRKFANRVVVEQMQQMGITRVTDGDRLVGSLSGGERQVAAIVRAVYFGAKNLILDEPTRGIDVGAKYEIYLIIQRLAAEGKGIIVISSELPEILGLSDRIYTVFEGQVTSDVPVEEATQESLMKSMTSARVRTTA